MLRQQQLQRKVKQHNEALSNPKPQMKGTVASQTKEEETKRQGVRLTTGPSCAVTPCL